MPGLLVAGLGQDFDLRICRHGMPMTAGSPLTNTCAAGDPFVGPRREHRPSSAMRLFKRTSPRTLPTRARSGRRGADGAGARFARD
ncbi:MAG: hypothetical protein R3E42_05920 [Burkholderiaceae bacterium]